MKILLLTKYKQVFKSILLFSIILLFVLCDLDNNDSKYVDDKQLEGWSLIWNDEFDGDHLDLTKWEYEVNAWGGGNNELQYYTDRLQNSVIQDGNLEIIARKEEYTGDDGSRDFTSARIRTLNKGDWLYGRIDVRAKLPTGRGLWPAIWMLPTEWKYGGWPASGEIDIMELLGHEPNKIYGTIHYGGITNNHVHTGSSYSLYQGTFNDDFHVFTIEWDVDEIRWYVDDILYGKQNEWFTANGIYPAPFNEKFHLLLNVAVGGNWPGNPDISTVFPQKMIIDYVRVYELDS